MSLPLWVSELVDEFWMDAGSPEDFPRNLRLPVALSLPVSVILLPHLHYDSIVAWLSQQTSLRLPGLDGRHLRACLVALNGHGAIFIDGADPEEEQRFSIAHEVGHFLLHYRKPRSIATRRVGQAVLEVMDGLRDASITEQIQSIVFGAEIDPHVHLMSREANGPGSDLAITRAEHQADLVAYELLAPSELVLSQTPHILAPHHLTDLLVGTYGLPVREAHKYAGALTPSSEPDTSLLQRLGLSS